MIAQNKEIFEKIIEFDKYHKQKINTKTQRFVYKVITQHVDDFYNMKNIPNLMFIIGLRGVGKTTILNTLLTERDAVYSSGDFLYRANISLTDFFENIKNISQKIIIIDEIQYLDWQLDVKIFADQNPDKFIIISGSSSVNISKFSADLIRRAKLFVVDPLSFREYLFIKNNIVIGFSSKIKEIIFSDSSLQEKYFDLIKIEILMPKESKDEFANYLKSSFPYMLEKYDKKVIQDVIYKVIYEDIPKIESFNTDNLEIIKKILQFLTVNEKTSLTTISKHTEKSKSLILKFVNLLEKAKLIDFVEDAVPTKRLGDAKKYLFYTPNFRYALTDTEPDLISGFSKEDLFVRIVKSLDMPVKYNYDKGQVDFYVGDKVFEIGSKSKKININKSKDDGKKGVIVVYTGELKYDGKNLYVPFDLFSLML